MSVEKYRIQKESSHFTTFQNTVLQGLKNYLEALGLYCYLASLPPAWEFNKEHLMKETNQGRDKLNKNLSILEKCNLIIIIQGRKENGQFGFWDMLVKDGTEFIYKEPQPLTEKPYTEKPLTENQSLENNDYKENNINNIKDIKQREREPSLSEEDFKTPELIKLCREKQLLFSLEYKKFSNYYQNREKTLGMFENWLLRAKSETKEPSSATPTLNDYIYRFMKDMKCTEEEARQYYFNRGYSA